MAVVGAGIVGAAVAWQLLRRGHSVTLVAPPAAALPHPGAGGAEHQGGGSRAALGVLIAQAQGRDSGRGWRLRQRSLALWQIWRGELAARGHRLPWRPGVLQLARSEAELAALGRLLLRRRALGFPLRLIDAAELQRFRPAPPASALGGLFSAADGQLDPIPALEGLLSDAARLGLVRRLAAVRGVERWNGRHRWRLHGDGGEPLDCDWLVITAGLASQGLLQPLGHHRPLEPVLGQALELQLPDGEEALAEWPGSLRWGDCNLVPRPGGRLWLGATLEAGITQGDGAALERLRSLEGQAPPWLRDAQVLHRWQGWRARPDGRPAPLLEQLEPGLLLASGHYRNGVLLAPATAEWVAQQIDGEPS